MNKSGISSRAGTASLSIIKRMMMLSEEEQKKGKNIVSLGVGIPYYKMPQLMRDKVIKELQENPDIDKYTSFAGISKLRKLIAQMSTSELGIPTEEEDILVTPGSMAALLYSMMGILDEGDEVIVPSPYFVSYAHQIEMAGGRIVEVPLIEPKNSSDTYRLDLQKIKDSITEKTKAIIINSPHNPTGVVYQKEELKKLAEILKDKKIFVITDEVYDYLVYDNNKYFNIASIEYLWPYVVRCCSFSKRFGMTGWRIGYVHTNKELLSNLLKIHDNTIVCAPHIAQMAVYFGLTLNPQEVEENVKSLEKNRDLICQRLSKLPDLFSYNIPQGAYYIFPKYSLNLPSKEFALKLLYEAGVVTVPGIGFGQVGERHLRLSFGSHAEDINEAFDRIEGWWSNNKS